MIHKGSVSGRGKVAPRSPASPAEQRAAANRGAPATGRTACEGADEGSGGPTARPARCQGFIGFLETLTPTSVVALSRLAAANMRFRDPIHDVRGVENVKRIYAGLFELVDDPRYTVTHCACTGEVCFLRWHFTCRPRIFGKGHPWIVDAVTVLQFDAQGRISEQVDYWDAGQYMYERFRFIGPVFRFFRKRRMRAG